MTSQFKHILIPLNFSEQNDRALDAVVEMTTGTQAKVTLMHVIEPINVSEDPEIENFLEELQNNADNELKERVKRFDGLDMTVSCEQRVGNRSKEVVTFAYEANVDLIVLNSNPLHGGKSGKLNASVGYQITVLANCAVLLLK